MAVLVVLPGADNAVLWVHSVEYFFVAAIVRSVMRDQEDVRRQIVLEVFQNALPARDLAVAGENGRDFIGHHAHDYRSVVAGGRIVVMRAEDLEIQRSNIETVPRLRRLNDGSRLLQLNDQLMDLLPVIG